MINLKTPYLEQCKQRVQHWRGGHLSVRFERRAHIVEHGGDLDDDLGGDGGLDEVNHLFEQTLVDQAWQWMISGGGDAKMATEKTIAKLKSAKISQR